MTGSHTKEEWLGVESRLNRAGLQRQEDEKVQTYMGEETEPSQEARLTHQKEQPAASGGVRSHTQLLLERRGRRDVQHPCGQWPHTSDRLSQNKLRGAKKMVRVMNDWHRSEFFKTPEIRWPLRKEWDIKEKVVSEMKSELEAAWERLKRNRKQKRGQFQALKGDKKRHKETKRDKKNLRTSAKWRRQRELTSCLVGASEEENQSKGREMRKASSRQLSWHGGFETKFEQIQHMPRNIVLERIKTKIHSSKTKNHLGTSKKKAHG